jgi:SAM-dependent methyltransferase
VNVYPWPFEDSSVSEVHCSHFLEHLDGVERVRFFNELYRVMSPGAKASIVTPHWASCRAYGDFTHKWPPVGEMLFYYISKEWRLANAPDNDAQWNPDGYTCNFAATWGYSMRQDLLVRNQEYQQFALQNFKEAAQDCIATLTKA